MKLKGQIYQWSLIGEKVIQGIESLFNGEEKKKEEKRKLRHSGYDLIFWFLVS